MSSAATSAPDAAGVKLCPRCGTRFDAAALYCQRDGALLEGPDETPDPYVGTTILDQLQIIEIIGTGGMGAVYRARQAGVERDVAVKILHRELVHNDEAMRRFQREARVASSLEHPNVVSVYMFGQLPDGNLYMAMELMRGQSLLDAMQLAQRESKTGGMDPARVLHIALQICDAVGEAHRRGIVHRDVKPENVFLVRRGKDPDFVKVLDFGIARFWMGSETVATKTGLVFGTAKYISPEGASGEHTDARSDVYSIAVVLYHMLAGEAPFDSPSPVALLMKHIHEPPPPLLARPGAAHVPREVADVLMRCLAKSPAARYDDAVQMGEALREAAVASGLIVEMPQGRGSMMAVAPPWSRSSHPPSDRPVDPSVHLAATPPMSTPALASAAGDDASARHEPTPEIGGTDRPSVAPIRPSITVGGMQIVDNEPMEIEAPDRAAISSPPTARAKIPLAPSPASREMWGAAADRPSHPGAWSNPPPASPFGSATSMPSMQGASGSTAMAWDAEEDDGVVPRTRRKGWLPWVLALAFFAVGASAVAAIAWGVGMIGPQRGTVAPPRASRSELARLEARARTALEHGAFDTPPGENVRELTDTILAAQQGHAGALALRVEAADRLHRTAIDASRQGLTDEAVALLDRALALAPDHEPSRRLRDQLHGAAVARTVGSSGVVRPTEPSPSSDGDARASDATSRGRARPRRGTPAPSGTPNLREMMGMPPEPVPVPPGPAPPAPPATEAPAGNPGDAVDWSIPEDPSSAAPPAPTQDPAPQPQPQPQPQQPPPGPGNDLTPVTPAPWVSGPTW
ncbi:MAG: protein kinase [Deltaproteobacteria bacterium]|nr:protein kinase [Deltaproteobacteria bacterium]